MVRRNSSFKEEDMHKTYYSIVATI